MKKIAVIFALITTLAVTTMFVSCESLSNEDAYNIGYAIGSGLAN